MNVLFDNFIAVTDSGVGGLTVLNRLQRQFPRCNFLYLADSAFCPYGTRPDSEIFARLCCIFRWLSKMRVAAAVLACNTASVFADKLRRRFDMPIFDVIAPTCRLAAQVTVSKRVALLATEVTVRSGAYRQLLAKNGVQLTSFPCSGLVPFAESGDVHSVECKRAVGKALRDFAKAHADAVVLGCTHFPILRDVIAPHVGNARIVECVTDFTPPAPCLAPSDGTTVYLTTGAVTAKKITSFSPEPHFVHINI